MPRTLTIFFPDGKTEYWFTALVFEPGDRLDHNGMPWIITSIGSPDGDGDGKHMTMTLKLDGDRESQASHDGDFAQPT